MGIIIYIIWVNYMQKEQKATICTLAPSPEAPPGPLNPFPSSRTPKDSTRVHFRNPSELFRTYKELLARQFQDMSTTKPLSFLGGYYTEFSPLI